MLSRENGGGGGAHASPPRSPLSRPLLRGEDDDDDDIAAAFAPAPVRPLLLIEEDTDADDDGGGAEQGAAPIKKWRLEARRLLALSLHLSMMSVLSYVGRAVTLSQVGALGALELSAVSLAGALYNVTGLSLVLGLASGAGVCVRVGSEGFLETGAALFFYLPTRFPFHHTPNPLSKQTKKTQKRSWAKRPACASIA